MGGSAGTLYPGRPDTMYPHCPGQTGYIVRGTPDTMRGVLVLIAPTVKPVVLTNCLFGLEDKVVIISVGSHSIGMSLGGLVLISVWVKSTPEKRRKRTNKNLVNIFLYGW